MDGPRFKPRPLLNQPTCYLHGAGHCWSPRAAVPEWEGAMHGKRHRGGERLPRPAPLCAALSVEGRTRRGRRDGRKGSCLGFTPLWAATHGPCPPTPYRDIHSAFHPFFLPFMKELFTGAVSTMEMTWFLHSGRDSNSQTSFQLEGNTTHELGTPSVSSAVTVCLLVKRKAQISL